MTPANARELEQMRKAQTEAAARVNSAVLPEEGSAVGKFLRKTFFVRVGQPEPQSEKTITKDVFQES